MEKIITGECHFILGHGEEAKAGDMMIELEYSPVPDVEWTLPIKHPYREEIIGYARNWVNRYAKDGINLKVKIVRAMIDPCRFNYFEKSVGLAFCDALPKIGIIGPTLFAPPPRISRILINSNNVDKMLEFYYCLGLNFDHIREGEQEWYSYAFDEFTYEMRHSKHAGDIGNIEISFFIDEIDGYMEEIKEMGIAVIKEPFSTDKNRHCLLKDFDGNILELISPLKNNG